MPNNTRKHRQRGGANVKTYRKLQSLRKSSTTAVIVGVVTLASLGLGLGLTLSSAKPNQ